MKQNILIISTGLQIGGVERSLIGLLEAIDYERFEVSLFLYGHDGEFMSMIPEEVQLLPENKSYAAIEKPIKEVLVSKEFPIALARLTAKFVRLFRKRVFGVSGFLLPRSVQYCLRFLSPIPGTYDLAISFITPHDPVINKITAKKNIGWIHTDYSTMECGVDHAFELPVWQDLDTIAAVSDSVKDTFSQVFPEVSDKIVVIENIVSSDFIRREAEEDVTKEMPSVPGEIRICSVGRFCHQKNFDSIPSIVRMLGAVGIRVRWYLIGFGSDESLIKNSIKEAGVEDKVIILEKKTSPYPYMRACDIYVQPSRYEGKAVTVREAQILGKPVLITNFPTAQSQLEDGVDGMICPLSVEGVADGIRMLVDDKELREKLAATCAERDYSNQDEVEKLYNLLEGKGAKIES
ncbi:glycosyltransferase [Akkermansiaceae bacterium]|nr:glycosyltransferase [Akkermansiaceae bacterium]MDB4695327.1 glycosyltransferase [Akkermansiaceae bacterium]